MVDDTLLVINTTDNAINIDSIFNEFYSKSLEFTSENMSNDMIQFLDILFIKTQNTVHHIMQIKPLKLEFFIPLHIKINIIKNMTQRALILSSTEKLFHHALTALRIRFHRSGYPDHFILKHMDFNLFPHRNGV